MKTLFDSICQTILNNPNTKTWVINLSKQRPDKYNTRHNQNTNFWHHNLEYSSTPLKDRNISISMFADLFANSGLLTNITGGTNYKLDKEVYIIKLRENKSDLNNLNNLSPEWERLWNTITKIRIGTQEKLINKMRIKRETDKLTSTIINTLKQEPYAASWLISLPRYDSYNQQSLNNVTKALSQENFNVYYSRVTTYPWMSNQVPQIILNINRKKSHECTFLKYLASNTNLIEDRFPDLICPISQNVMQYPVILGTTGHTYERSQIIEALIRIPNKDPISNSIIYNNTLTPNYALINIMKQIREENMPGILNASTNANNINRTRSHQETHTEAYAV